MSFKLDYLPPAPDMVDQVSAYYLFDTDEDTLDELERADIGQLRFALRGEGVMHLSEGATAFIHPVSVYGPRVMASRIIARGPVTVFGLGLLPSGWAALTRLDASTATNCILDGTSLFGAAATSLFARLRDCTAIAEMKALAEGFLRGQFAANSSQPDLWFVHAVYAWLESDINPDLDTLVAQTGLTLRRVEMLMKQYYGAPPKMIVRKYRALRTANAIAHGRGDWRDFASECYYDHSHCIRDVKRFVGITPAAIADHPHRLLGLTFGRSALAGEIAPLSAVS